MHLTNYSINKNSPDFVFNTDNDAENVGHKQSVIAVFERLRSMGHDIDLLWERIRRLIIKAFCAVQPKISQHYKSCDPSQVAKSKCFEILGFDVILDKKMKPWLLEINYTPSFTADTPLDKRIKEGCVKEALDLMNINIKNKQNFIKEERARIARRSHKGREPVLAGSELKRKISELMVKRAAYEDTKLVNYRRIYPLEP